MHISGMQRINENLRNESRNRARKISREEVGSQNGRTERSNLGNNQNLKKYILPGIFLLVSILLALIIVNWRSVNKVVDAMEMSNTVSESVINDKNNADGIGRLLLVVTTGDKEKEVRIERVYALSHNEQKGDRVVIYIPGEVYIPLANDLVAPYSSISNMHYAGETVKPGLGESYLIWEIEQYLGYEFDSYLWLDEEATQSFVTNMGADDEDDPKDYFSKLVSISNPFYLLIKGEKVLEISDSFHSNLSSRDTLNELSKYSLSTFSDVQFIDFSTGEFVTKEALPTGDEVPFLNREGVDKEISDIGLQMLEKDIEKEQTKIEVYNGSEISGLGGRYSRALVNNGLRVIRVDNADEKIVKTQIYVPQQEEYEKSLQMVLGLTPVEVEVIEGRPNFLTTGDIIVVLGEDNLEETNWLQK